MLLGKSDTNKDNEQFISGTLFIDDLSRCFFCADFEQAKHWWDLAEMQALMNWKKQNTLN